MSALACLVVSAFLAYLIAQFGKRCAASKSTTAWREASELVFDRNLRFQIKQEYENGMEPSNADGYAASRDSLVSHLASNLLMLANRRLEIEPPRSEAEEFVRQQCDLDDDLIEQLWINQFTPKTLPLQ